MVQGLNLRIIAKGECFYETDKKHKHRAKLSKKYEKILQELKKKNNQLLKKYIALQTEKQNDDEPNAEKNMTNNKKIVKSRTCLRTAKQKKSINLTTKW